MLCCTLAGALTATRSGPCFESVYPVRLAVVMRMERSIVIGPVAPGARPRILQLTGLTGGTMIVDEHFAYVSSCPDFASSTLRALVIAVVVHNQSA